MHERNIIYVICNWNFFWWSHSVILFSTKIKSDEDGDAHNNPLEVVFTNVPVLQVMLANGTSTISVLGYYGNIAIVILTYDNEDKNLTSTSLQCIAMPCMTNEVHFPLPKEIFSIDKIDHILIGNTLISGAATDISSTTSLDL